MRVLKLLLSACAAASALTAGSAEAQAVIYKLNIAPQQEQGLVKGISDLKLQLEVGPLDRAAGETLFRMPLLNDNVDTLAEAVEILSASDAAGALKLTARTSTSGTPSREWTAPRATKGPVTVTYKAPASALRPPRGPAPPLALMSEEGAFSGAGGGFLLFPAISPPKYQFKLTWDLKALPTESRAISSLGDGALAQEGSLSEGEIGSLFFMAGAIDTWPAKLPRGGFAGAWQGRPPFSGEEMMSWAAKLYRKQYQFFNRDEAPAYNIFLRYNPINAGGGTALFQSFVITYGKGVASNVDELKGTLSHEMFHTLQPQIDEDGEWFTEGSAVFYGVRLPVRFGLMPVSLFLDGLNSAAARYYTSAMAELPNAAIEPGFWKDTRIRTLPYDRGMLYLATVDEALRARTNGKKSLDDLLFEFLHLQEKKGRLTNADWRDLVERELGTTGAKAFDGFLAGVRPIPSSSAFGPCFRRIEVPLRRYEVGFEPAVLGEPKRVVRGLVAGSAAEAAGLRNGDEIVKPVPQDGIQGNQTQVLELEIRRDSKVFAISYLPRGETVSTYQWERVPSVPDNACKL